MLNKTVGGWPRTGPAALAVTVTVAVTLEIGLGSGHPSCVFAKEPRSGYGSPGVG